jgi:hypothetical protein
MDAGLGLQHEAHAALGVVVGMERGEFGVDGGEAGGGLLAARVVPQPRHHVHEVVAAAIERPRALRHDRLHLHQRHPAHRIDDREDAAELRRRHADHLHRAPVEEDLLADRVARIAEERPRARRTQHHHGVRAAPGILLVDEESPVGWSRPERGEVVGRDDHPHQLLRTLARRDVERGEGPARDAGEDVAGAFAHVEVVRHRTRAERDPRRGAEDLHDPLRRRGARQRPQQQRLHRREDRRVEADGDGHREDHDRGEEWVLHQQPAGESEVVQERLHGGPGGAGRGFGFCSLYEADSPRASRCGHPERSFVTAGRALVTWTGPTHPSVAW